MNELLGEIVVAVVGMLAGIVIIIIALNLTDMNLLGAGGVVFAVNAVAALYKAHRLERSV